MKLSMWIKLAAEKNKFEERGRIRVRNKDSDRIVWVTPESFKAHRILYDRAEPRDQKQEPKKPGTKAKEINPTRLDIEQPDLAKATNSPDPALITKMRSSSIIPGFKNVKEFAASEWNEYNENDGTKTRFPDAFKNKNDWVNTVSKAPTKKEIDFSDIDNNNVGDLENIKSKEERIRFVKNMVWEFKADNWLSKADDADKAKKLYSDYFDKLLTSVEKDDTPPTLIGIHKDKKGKKTKYLLAGNTRAMMYKALGKSVPIKEIPLKGRMVEQEDNGEDQEQGYLDDNGKLITDPVEIAELDKIMHGNF